MSYKKNEKKKLTIKKIKMASLTAYGKKNRIKEITESETIETPLQILSEKSLWEELISTYPTESFDHVTFNEFHFKNGLMHYMETGNLAFNLLTLKPTKKSSIQTGLDPELLSRIKNNPAYRKFSKEKISFIKLSNCKFFSEL